VSLVDLTPVLLASCSIATDDGSSDASRPDGRAAFMRDAIYAENGRPLNGVRLLERWFPEFDASSIDHPMRMVRAGPEKLIWTADVGAELYDVVADPAELADLSTGWIDRRDALLGTLRTWTLGLRPVAGRVREMPGRDVDSLERLRRLGYVE
jgi:hypothetical protein